MRSGKSSRVTQVAVSVAGTVTEEFDDSTNSVALIKAVPNEGYAVRLVIEFNDLQLFDSGWRDTVVDYSVLPGIDTERLGVSFTGKKL